MTTQEKLDKVMDMLKDTNDMLTSILKKMDLIPITEAEEKQLQILTRSNQLTREKVYDDLEKITNPDDTTQEDFLTENVYGDVLGNDIPLKFKK